MEHVDPAYGSAVVLMLFLLLLRVLAILRSRTPQGRNSATQSVVRMLDYILAFASAAATSRELMSSVIMKPLVPLNSNGFSPAR